MDDLILVPEPKIVESSNLERKGAKRLEEALSDYTIGSGLPEGIRTSIDESLNPAESYNLNIREESIEIRAASERGLFYGVQTLRQILRQSRGDAFPVLSVRDWPDFPHRALMLDISRDRVPTMETLFYLIDLWSELKFNQLQLYTEHTFAYSDHREVWEDASPMQAEEIRALDTYCRRRGIELVPNQNSFGHMERWLQHPSYRHLAEAETGFIDPWGNWRSIPTTLSPMVPDSLKLLENLYDELLPLFQSSLFNVGGDETYELCQGKSKPLCEEKGNGWVYLNFLNKIHKLAAARGHRIMVYADILLKYDHLVEDLPEDIILIDWGYEEDHPFEAECKKIAESGLDYYVCAGSSAWNSIGGRWSNAKKNVLNAARTGLKYGAEGFILSEWGDNGHWQQLPTGIPAVYLSSVASWNRKAAECFDPVKSMALHFFRSRNTSKAMDAARALMLLQDISSNPVRRIHNASIQAALLLDSSENQFSFAMPVFRAYNFKEELSNLDEAERLLSGLRGEIQGLLWDELMFTLRLLKHACDQGRYRLATQGLSIAEIDAEQKKTLADELEKLIEEYRRLWSLRSRPGGLKESIGRMEELKRKYLS